MTDDTTPLPPDPLAGRPEFLEGFPSDDPEGTTSEDYPPVEPPSAGFIVQLFVVPAVIVTVIVGVYLLFGRLASGEQDWRKQLTDIRSENPHVRWRGALGLAQMLQADVTAEGTRLAENRDVAEELALLLTDSLSKASVGEDDLKQQEFLARTLGLIDVDDVVLPALTLAIQPDQDETVRKNALASLATIANRRRESGESFSDAGIVDDVVAATESSEPMLRHVATYTLGLLESTTASDRLKVLVDHPDRMTQVNAAIGLARQGQPTGLPVFESVLADSQNALNVPIDETAVDESAESAEALEEALMLSNSLKAISELSGQMTVAQKQQFIDRLLPLAKSHPQPQLRVEVRELLTQLRN